MAVCTYSGCGKVVKALGLCSGHAEQQRCGRDLHPLRAKLLKNESPGPCAFEGCDRQQESAESGGLCRYHRRQRRERKPLTSLRRRNQQLGDSCSAPDCTRKIDSHGLCFKHYSRLPVRRLDSAKRRAHRGTLGVVSDAVVARVKSATRCFYCDQFVQNPEMEHLIPTELGGSNIWWNLLPSCLRCNRRKNSKEPGIWLNGKVLGGKLFEFLGRTEEVQRREIDAAEQRRRLVSPEEWSGPAPETSLWARLGLPLQIDFPHVPREARESPSDKA